MSTGEGGRNRAHLTNKSYFTSRSFILIFVGLFYIKGTKYLTFRKYITNSFNGNVGDVHYQVVNHQTRPASGGLLTLATMKAKLAKI